MISVHEIHLLFSLTYKSLALLVRIIDVTSQMTADRGVTKQPCGRNSNLSNHYSHTKSSFKHFITSYDLSNVF